MIRNFYIFILGYFFNLFKTTSILTLTAWNYFKLKVKTSILLFTLIIMNKPLLILIINIIISFLIRGMFINTIYAEEFTTLHDEMNDIKKEPGTPVYFSNIFKWFMEGLIWFLHFDPPRPPMQTILIPEQPFPGNSLYDISQIPPTFVPNYLRMNSILEYMKNNPQFFITQHYSHELLDDSIAVQHPITLIPMNVNIPVTTTTVLHMKSSQSYPQDSYDAWVQSTEIPLPLFNDPLLKELHLKLQECHNPDNLFNTSIDFVKLKFPHYKWATSLSDFHNPHSDFNFYLFILSKSVQSEAEVVSYFHYKCAALAYNKAVLYNEHENPIMIRYYFNQNLLDVRSYTDQVAKRVL